jgi:hypothetical protein
MGPNAPVHLPGLTMTWRAWGSANTVMSTKQGKPALFEHLFALLQGPHRPAGFPPAPTVFTRPSPSPIPTCGELGGNRARSLLYRVEPGVARLTRYAVFGSARSVRASIHCEDVVSHFFPNARGLDGFLYVGVIPQNGLVLGGPAHAQRFPYATTGRRIVIQF